MNGQTQAHRMSFERVRGDHAQPARVKTSACPQVQGVSLSHPKRELYSELLTSSRWTRVRQSILQGRRLRALTIRLFTLRVVFWENRSLLDMALQQRTLTRKNLRVNNLWFRLLLASVASENGCNEVLLKGWTTNVRLKLRWVVGLGWEPLINGVQTAAI
jgi:hypothetical protein